MVSTTDNSIVQSGHWGVFLVKEILYCGIAASCPRSLTWMVISTEQGFALRLGRVIGQYILRVHSIVLEKGAYSFNGMACGSVASSSHPAIISIRYW